MHDGRIHIYNTNIGVKATEDVGGRVLLAKVIVLLKARGFDVSQYAITAKHYPTLARNYWRATKGDLKVKFHCVANQLDIMFYQDMNVSNPNGGEYDFDKYQRMSRPMQLRLITEMHAIVRRFEKLGCTLRHKNGEEFTPSMLDIRDLIAPPNRRATLAEFNDRWNFESDWKCGGRFERDETGWPSASEIGVHKDRNGVVIRNGDTRYMYHRGNLMRGVVRPNMNGMWFVGDFACDGSSTLFQLGTTMVPRRNQVNKSKRLRQELDRALKCDNFKRVATIAAVIHREVP